MVDTEQGLVAAGLTFFGAGLLAYSIWGLRRGRLRPALRTILNEPYGVASEPIRFWLSLTYNLLLASVTITIGVVTAIEARRDFKERPLRQACLEQKRQSPKSLIAVCDRWMAGGRLAAFDLGLARARQAEAHDMLGEERQATLLRRAAIGAYGQSLSGFPDDSAAHWNSALLMVKLGDLRQARRSFQDYVALEPDRGDGWLELGLVELQLNLLPDALTSLTRAVERSPGETAPLAARAIAFGLAGDRVRAATDVEAARELDPQEPFLKDADRLIATAALDRPTSRTPP